MACGKEGSPVEKGKGLEACGAVMLGWEAGCNLLEGRTGEERGGGSRRSQASWLPCLPLTELLSPPQVWLHKTLQLPEQPSLQHSQGSVPATLRLQASFPAQKHQLLGIIHHCPSAIPYDTAWGPEKGPVAGLTCLLWAWEAAGPEARPGGGRVPPAVPGTACACACLPAPLPGDHGAQWGPKADRDPEEEGTAPLFLETLQLPGEGGATKGSRSTKGISCHC